MKLRKLKKPVNFFWCLFSLLFPALACSQTLWIDKYMYHLRTADKVEWKDFKGMP